MAKLGFIFRPLTSEILLLTTKPNCLYATHYSASFFGINGEDSDLAVNVTLELNPSFSMYQICNLVGKDFSPY